MAMNLRMIIFIAVVILLSFCMIFSSETDIFKILDISEVTMYTNYCTEKSNLSGDGYSLLCSVGEYSKFEGKVNGISFETSLTPPEIINKLGLKILSTQNSVSINNKEVFYCFAENISDYVVIDNKRVNFQIAFDGEKCTVGIPLILGSY